VPVFCVKDKNEEVLDEIKVGLNRNGNEKEDI
jgi:hypothetical protein